MYQKYQNYISIICIILVGIIFACVVGGVVVSNKESVTNGNVTDGNITDGNVTDGNITDGNVTDGNVTGGDVSEAETEQLLECTDVTEIEEDESPRYIYLGEYRLTAYCNCRTCCGVWAGGATASGVMPTSNHTIAVDRSIIPFGTEVIINGNTYVAEDTGSAIVGNRIDIYFDSHQEAMRFGVQYADVYKVVY